MKALTTLIAFIFSIHAFAQQNIADAKTYREGEIVTVSGVVTNGNELGGIRYLQDSRPMTSTTKIP